MRTALGPLAVTTVQTPWGWAGLAATRRGLLACAWPFTEPDQALQALNRELERIARRAASRSKAGDEIAECDQPHSGQDLVQWAAAALLAFFRGSLREIEKLPLDGRYFTGWQRKVYEAVRSIRPGDVRSYGEVAIACGGTGARGRAARAVGQAMAGNPLPLFIPCHRVVRGDKQPGNYGCGGTDMKVRLLAHESGGAGG